MQLAAVQCKVPCGSVFTSGSELAKNRRGSQFVQDPCIAILLHKAPVKVKHNQRPPLCGLLSSQLRPQDDGLKALHMHMTCSIATDRLTLLVCALVGLLEVSFTRWAGVGCAGTKMN